LNSLSNSWALPSSRDNRDINSGGHPQRQQATDTTWLLVLPEEGRLGIRVGLQASGLSHSLEKDTAATATKTVTFTIKLNSKNGGIRLSDVTDSVIFAINTNF